MSQKSFTTRKDPIDFEIDDESFNLKASVPAGRMTELSRLAGEMQVAAKADGKEVVDPRIAQLSALVDEILAVVTSDDAESLDPRLTEVGRIAGEMKALTASEDTDGTAPLFKALEEIFEPESLGRFKRRFDGEYAPIDIGTFYEIITWIFGEALGKGITLPQSS